MEASEYKMHYYAANNQDLRLKIRIFIALLSLILSICLLPFFVNSSFNFPTTWPALSDTSKILVFPIVFSLLYALYDRLLWKFNPFDGIPILYGTWIGIADNQRAKDPPRLEQMLIEQTWSQISVSINVYEQNPLDPKSWHNAKKLGAEYSTNAFISECLHGQAKFNFQYGHDDEAKGQSSFGGSFFLRYNHERKKKESVYKLKGKYCTTKKIDGYEGIFGRISFRRISSKVLGFSDALAQGQYYLDSLAKDVKE